MRGKSARISFVCDETVLLPLGTHIRSTSLNWNTVVHTHGWATLLWYLRLRKQVLFNNHFAKVTQFRNRAFSHPSTRKCPMLDHVRPEFHWMQFDLTLAKQPPSWETVHSFNILTPYFAPRVKGRGDVVQKAKLVEFIRCHAGKRWSFPPLPWMQRGRSSSHSPSGWATALLVGVINPFLGIAILTTFCPLEFSLQISESFSAAETT